MKRTYYWLRHARIDDLRPWQKPFVFVYRILATSIRRFVQNDGSTRSAGLTYWTLMAIVPVLAVVSAIAGAFGARGDLEDVIRRQSGDYPEAAQEVIERVLQIVQKVDVRALSAVGVLGLLYTAFAVMSRIESAFNVTWQAPRARNLARRYADYVALLFLVPLLVLASSSLTTMLNKQVRTSIPWLADVLQQGFFLVPVLLLWIAASLLLKVVPNARVKWIPALIAGLFTAIVFVTMQWLFLALQVGVTQANALYGTFAFLPLFLIYLHASWSIVIVGAELGHTIQYREVVLRPVHERRWTPEKRRHLGLFLARETVARHRKGATFPLSEAASRLDVSRAHVKEVAKILSRCGVLHLVRGGAALVPGKPPGELSAGELFSSLDHEGELPESRSTEAADAELLERARAALAEFDEKI